MYLSPVKTRRAIGNAVWCKRETMVLSTCDDGRMVKKPRKCSLQHIWLGARFTASVGTSVVSYVGALISTSLE